MQTDKKLLVKGFKFIGFTVALMFLAPVVLHQAIKNEEHPFFWPVAIIGFLIAIAAIAMGFYSIKVIMDALFARNKRQK